MQLLVLLSLFIGYCICTPVSVNWTNVVATSKTATTLQVVVNPELRREGSMHDGAFNAVKLLGADYVRFVPWLPYPALAVAELYPPTGNPVCGSVINLQDLYLGCSDGGVFSSIQFAAYGTTEGTCGNYTIVGNCSAEGVLQIVEKYCLGQESCTIPATTDIFGDPCYGTVKRLAVQAACDVSTFNTSWNFSLIDPMMEDFMEATKNHSVIINFSTIPQWMWNTALPVPIPDDPNQVIWNYEQGTDPRDPTLQQIAQYYARLLAWYTKGGFTDEYGTFHQSGHYYNITMWEVLNEIEAEHTMSPEFYTRIYDAMVTAMLEVQPDMIFVGLALGDRDPTYFQYFLNISNHDNKDIPIDWISYHFYASCADRANVTEYAGFFSDADGFFGEVASIEAIRKQLSPTTKTTIDEIGVILPNDNAADPGDIPPLYWNAAGAMYAYIFGNLLPVGIDVLGESQLIGYITQFPSVSMIDYNTNQPNARFWVLYSLHNNFGVGDTAVDTNVDDTTIFAAAYITKSGKKLMILNKTPQTVVVDLTKSGFTSGTIEVVDVTTGDQQPTVQPYNSTFLNLGAYAVVIITFSSS